MSEHLSILKEMFPGQLVLDVDQIAQCMKVGKGHIYNLASAKKLPFRLDQGLAKSSVSIVRFAQYLDSQLTPDKADVAMLVAVRKGPGRPRGSTKANARTQLFQSELRTAICKAEGLAVLNGAVQCAVEMTISHDVGENCASEFEFSRMALLAQIQNLRTRFADMMTNIGARAMDPLASAEPREREHNPA
jgi:hypothetical protein